MINDKKIELSDKTCTVVARYDSISDAVSIRFTRERLVGVVARSEHAEGNLDITFDYDLEGRLLGFSILNPRDYLPEAMYKQFIQEA